ncbi:hypothetical protein HY469_00030 [Candidatus Roizmanbacteria bacterium]|nr:hypothetical protein [Candidatus Roizmanbacteria bacterium]
MHEKTGYVLLYGGLILILFATVNIILVLTAKIDPIAFYKPEDISLDFSWMIPSYQIPGLPEAIRPEETQSPSVKSEVLANSLNVLLHLFLMGFLVNVGSRIATLGTNLIRPVIVKLNQTERELSSAQKPPIKTTT